MTVRDLIKALAECNPDATVELFDGNAPELTVIEGHVVIERADLFEGPPADEEAP